MAHLHDVDKIKPDDERVQSRVGEDGGHKWRMWTESLFALSSCGHLVVQVHLEISKADMFNVTKTTSRLCLKGNPKARSS